MPRSNAPERPEERPEPPKDEPERSFVLEQLTIPVRAEKRKGWFDQLTDKLIGDPKPKVFLPEKGMREAGFVLFTVKANGQEVKYLRCPCGKNHMIKE